MKLKLDDKGNVVLQDGKPVYVNDDGSEVAADVPGLFRTIADRNGEAKKNRERYEAAETKLKAFEGIEDPAAAIEALNTVKNFSEKKLVDAGKVEEIKAAAIKAVRDEYAPVVAERDKLATDIRTLTIGGSFARSKFIAEKLAIPSDLVESRFGKHFEMTREGKVVAKDHAGNVIYSKANPGVEAEFEEAIETIVSAYPQKDSILKGTGASGSGAPPNAGGGGGPKTLTRTVFDALAPGDQAAKMKDGFKVVDG